MTSTHTPIARIIYGSHLFGTTVATSDTDHKSIHIPGARDILLQRAAQTMNFGSKSLLTPSQGGLRGGRPRPSTAEDNDDESHALHKFLDMLRGGHMVAIELLFAPDGAMQRTTPLWRGIVARRDRFLSRRLNAFVGYCQSQADGYRSKSETLACAQAALVMLDREIAARGGATRLSDIADVVERFVEANPPATIETKPSGLNLAMRHLVIGGRMSLYTSSLDQTRGVVARVVARFGTRSIAAATRGNVDWKSLYHAVRVGEQAIELARTGRITFPRPNAADLVAIRRGERPVDEIVDRIAGLIVETREAEATSDLRAEPDHLLMDDILAEAYSDQVRNGHRRDRDAA